MSSFFGKNKTGGTSASSATAASKTPTIRHEVRKVVRPADPQRAQQTAVRRDLLPPKPARPPANRYTLTPSTRVAARSASHTSSASSSLKSRASTIRSGQKRKSASPAAPVFGSDDSDDDDEDDRDDDDEDDHRRRGNRSSNTDTTPSPRPAASKRARVDATESVDTTRRVRDVKHWPSEEQLKSWLDPVDKRLLDKRPSDSSPSGGRPRPDKKLVHGRDLCVGDYAKDYTPVFDGDEPTPTVQLQYPSGAARETFVLAEPRKHGDYRPVEDVVNTVVEVLRHYLPDAVARPLLEASETGANTTLEFRLRRAFRQRSWPDFRDTVDEYNRTVEKHVADGQIAAHMDDTRAFPSPLRFDLVKRILAQIYARTVSPQVELLSRYANKENTYGELREPFASQIFKDTGLRSDHVFLDLGSGVGNVVLQAALEVGCRSYGIEMMEHPCRLADAQAAELPRRARLWGLAVGAVKLWRGDFLDDALVSQLLARADVVLVNNEVFGPDLNNALKDRLLDLKEGARLVSLKSFVPDGWKLAHHTRNDPIAGLEVRQRQFWSNWVSWKYDGGEYFVATKDSSRIERILSRR